MAALKAVKPGKTSRMFVIVGERYAKEGESWLHYLPWTKANERELRKFEKLIREVECHVRGDDSFGVSYDLIPEEAIDAHLHVRTQGVSVVFNKLDGTFKCPTFDKWDRETKEGLAIAFEDKMYRGFAALVSAEPPAKRAKKDDAEEEDDDEDADDEDADDEEDAVEASAGAGKAAPKAKKAAAKGKATAGLKAPAKGKKAANKPAAGGAGAAKKAAKGKR